MECEGVRLVGAVPVHSRLDMVFVQCAAAHAGYKAFPDARPFAGTEPETLLLPAVEISRDVNLLRVGRPHGEVSAVNSSGGNRVRAQFIIEAYMAALVEEVKVIAAQQTERLHVRIYS